MQTGTSTTTRVNLPKLAEQSQDNYSPPSQSGQSSSPSKSDKGFAVDTL